MKMIDWLFVLYLLMASTIIILACVCVDKSEKIKDLKEEKEILNENYNDCVSDYLKYKEKYQEDEKILQNIKDLLPF